MKYTAPQSDQMTKMEIEHMELVQSLAGECVVLLENNGCLPLKKTGNIALYGTGGRRTIKGGTGSGDVYSRSVVNYEQGLEEAGFVVTTKAWLDRQDTIHETALKEYITWAHEESLRTGTPESIVSFDTPFKNPEPNAITDADIQNSETNVAVYVISRNSGEGADRFNERGDYLASEAELEQIRLLGQKYDDLIVALNIGGVMNIDEIRGIEGVSAILLMSQLGNIGGHILPQILLGQVNPSGKLVDTWAKDYMDYPSSKNFSHNNDNVDDEDYEDGIYVGYRYFDSFQVEPFYPFGYGLSYTQFALSDQTVAAKGNEITVQVTVTNTGAYAGKEVLQLYVSKPGKEIDVPYQELRAFQKTSLLGAGASEKITLTFDLKNCASYHQDQAAYILEAGEYVIRLGNSSKNTTVVGVVELDASLVIEECRNLFAPDREISEIKPAAILKNVTAAEKIQISAKDIETRKNHYLTERPFLTTDQRNLTVEDVRKGNCTVEELVAQFSVDELALLCVGSSRMEFTEEGTIVGGSSIAVPGAAGDSTIELLEKYGVKNLIQADGPAGLRLQPHFKTTADGKILPGGEMFGDFVVPFDLEKLPKDAIDYYQYCTAMPIGWALAMSWNTDMVEVLGRMVGAEMELFQIDLWLAPALNIHRNPLCGRNFEYYSEDPYVSGQIAAAMTRGVQSHPGRGTTIKHFAANNQEDNRYFTNAHVSERALREIYLKGFEIAVKEAQPYAIMTSYNLVNGIHTANSKDLNQHILRDEWGYEGFVMTDWLTSQDVPNLTGGGSDVYPISASTGCVYAGNDLQMPGCQKNVDDLVEAVVNDKEIDGYKITKADLQYCAVNIVRAAMKTIG